MNSVWDVPVFGDPVRFDVDLRVEWFFGVQGFSRKEDFGKEILAEAGEGRSWVSVWSSGGWDKFQAEANDGSEGFWYGCAHMGEIMEGRI